MIPRWVHALLLDIFEALMAATNFDTAADDLWQHPTPPKAPAA
jgi:hypothetical protein